MGEQQSVVRGHRTTPARILEVVASAVDGTVLGLRVTDLARAGGRARRVQRGTVQRKGGYVAGAFALIQTESAAALMKEIRRSLRCNDGVEASLESILGRRRIKELLFSRRVRLQFDASVRDVPFEGAHTFDQPLGETDRAVQYGLVNVWVMPIMEMTRVYDAALVRVARYRQT